MTGQAFRWRNRALAAALAKETQGTQKDGGTACRRMFAWANGGHAKSFRSNRTVPIMARSTRARPRQGDLTDLRSARMRRAFRAACASSSAARATKRLVTAR